LRSLPTTAPRRSLNESNIRPKIYRWGRLLGLVTNQWAFNASGSCDLRLRKVIQPNSVSPVTFNSPFFTAPADDAPTLHNDFSLQISQLDSCPALSAQTQVLRVGCRSLISRHGYRNSRDISTYHLNCLIALF